MQEFRDQRMCVGVKIRENLATLHSYFVYKKPFDSVTSDCTPETRDRCVVFLSLSLYLMHLFFIFHVYILFKNNALTN